MKFNGISSDLMFIFLMELIQYDFFGVRSDMFVDSESPLSIVRYNPDTPIAIGVILTNFASWGTTLWRYVFGEARIQKVLHSTSRR